MESILNHPQVMPSRKQVSCIINQVSPSNARYSLFALRYAGALLIKEWNLNSPPLMLKLESVASIEIQIDSQFDWLQIYSLKSFSLSKILMIAVLLQAGCPTSCHRCGNDVRFFSIKNSIKDYFFRGTCWINFEPSAGDATRWSNLKPSLRSW